MQQLSNKTSVLVCNILSQYGARVIVCQERPAAETMPVAAKVPIAIVEQIDERRATEGWNRWGCEARSPSG